MSMQDSTGRQMLVTLHHGDADMGIQDMKASLAELYKQRKAENNEFEEMQASHNQRLGDLNTRIAMAEGAIEAFDHMHPNVPSPPDPRHMQQSHVQQHRGVDGR